MTLVIELINLGVIHRLAYFVLLIGSERKETVSQ